KHARGTSILRCTASTFALRRPLCPRGSRGAASRIPAKQLFSQLRKFIGDQMAQQHVWQFPSHISGWAEESDNNLYFACKRGMDVILACLRREWRKIQVDQQSPRNAGRAPSQEVQLEKATATGERLERRHEPGWAASRSAVRGCRLSRRPPQATGSSAGHHGHLAGEATLPGHLRRNDSHGY